MDRSVLRRVLRGSLACAWIGVLAAAGNAQAQDAEPDMPQPPPAGAPATAGEPMLETAREAVRASTVWLARGVDSWFGDRPFEQGGKVSDGVLGVGLFKRKGEAVDANVRLNARLRLPNLGESSFAFLGRDNPQEVVADKPGAVTRQDRLQRESSADREFFAGIGVALIESFDLRLGLRGGFKPYVQARYRDEWPLREDVLLEFRQTFFVSQSDRLGSTTAVSVSQAWSPELVLRWLNSATVTQRKERYEWTSVVAAYRSFEGRRLLSMEVLASGVQNSGVTVDDIGLLLKWEQPVLRKWLVGEVVLGHFWPRPDPAVPRTRQWAAGVGVRVSF